MRTLGLLGGMTYNATVIYYTIINKQIQTKLGGPSSADLLLRSFNHAEMGGLFNSGNWDEATIRLTNAAKGLKAAGANGIMICCNIGHMVADEVERQSGLPLLHIADYTGVLVKERGLDKVVLIGTKTVMEEAFFKERLRQKFGLDVVVPAQEQRRKAINDMIFDELGANVFTKQSKELLLDTIQEAVSEGAQGVIFACTELQFLVKPEDVDVPLWDTMQAHAMGAAEWALAGGK